MTDAELVVFIDSLNSPSNEISTNDFVTKTFTTLELSALKLFVREMSDTLGDMSMDIDTDSNRIAQYAMEVLKAKFT